MFALDVMGDAASAKLGLALREADGLFDLVRTRRFKRRNSAWLSRPCEAQHGAGFLIDVYHQGLKQPRQLARQAPLQ